MIPSTSTLRASRRKSTSPSIPPLRNNSSRSILSLTTVVLLSRASVLPAKDDAVVSLTPDPLLFLHHFLGLYLREHYKHVPPYLRDLLMMCSYEYTPYPSSYIQLVQALLAEKPSDVLFIVLNYDDLLEQALYRFTGGEIRFESLDDYVRADRPVKLVKLHGSINWFKPIGSVSGDWKSLVERSDVLARPEENTIHVAE